MSANEHCSKCSSENVRYSRKSASYDCEDCGHVWKEEKPKAPLRLFLSYGHDGNESLVRRIKADLEKRGHDVWFDKAEIKAGDDWRRSITDGITGSHKFVSFLSKHSTRDPGVCLDEIAIAIGVKGGNIQTILVESEQEVKPPASISHIQWLDMHDWKERRAAGETAWESWYQEKFAEVVAVVESDESRRFAGEIQKLGEHLKPIASDSRIATLLRKGFIGRKWLFEALEDWRAGRARHSVRAAVESENVTSRSRRAEDCAPYPESRLFWITGDPGVGKSAFAAHITHFGRDKVIAAQFCEWDKPDHRNAPRVVRSLAFQLATRLPDYRKLLLTLPEIAELDRKDAAELFDYLLANPLRSVIHGGRERYLIVIDALDEAGEAGRNPLVEMLARNAQRLPDWLGLIVTSRPEFDVKTPLQALNPFPLDTQSESNRADIRDYLRRELATPLQDRPDADRLVEQILEKSEGVFLYVERFCDDVQRGHLSLDRPEQFPQGLGGIFCQYFQRQFPDLEKFRKDVRPALRAILAAREPLPVEILQRLFHWQDEELHDFTRPLASLFPVAKEANGEVIKPYHKSLADWLTDEAKAGVHFVSVLEGNKLLAENGWSECQSAFFTVANYHAAHLPDHLLKASRYGDLVIILWSKKFMTAVRERDLVVELLNFCDPLIDSADILPVDERMLVQEWRQKTPEELLGRTIHNRWLQEAQSSDPRSFTSESRERLREWERLTSQHRSRARRQASDVFQILRVNGFGFRPSVSSDSAKLAFTESEIERLAEGEHERWCRELQAEGWRAGSIRNIQARISPFVAPWRDCPEGAWKEYDRLMCRTWAKLLAACGYEIVRQNAESVGQE